MRILSRGERIEREFDASIAEATIGRMAYQITDCTDVPYDFESVIETPFGFFLIRKTLLIPVYALRRDDGHFFCWVVGLD